MQLFFTQKNGEKNGEVLAKYQICKPIHHSTSSQAIHKISALLSCILSTFSFISPAAAYFSPLIVSES
jgi:hypothetical protein